MNKLSLPGRGFSIWTAPVLRDEFREIWDTRNLREEFEWEYYGLRSDFVAMINCFDEDYRLIKRFSYEVWLDEVFYYENGE